jgi:hypothetical protein
MLAKDPAQRPQTPKEVADELAPFVAKPIGPPPDDEMPRLSPAASVVLKQAKNRYVIASSKLLQSPRPLILRLKT